MKIATKINLSFSAAAVALASFSLFALYTEAKTNLQEAIYAHLSTTAVSRARHVETHLEEDKARLWLLAESDQIGDSIREIIHNASNLKDFPRDLSAILKDYYEVEKEACELLILNPDGKVIASTDEGSVGADESTEVHFLKGKDRTYIREAYGDKSGAPKYSISVPIRDDDSNTLLGVIVGRFEMAKLNEILTDRTGLGETGEIYIVNKSGYMITPSRFTENTFLKQKINMVNFHQMSVDRHEKSHSGHGSTNIYPDYRGVNVLGTHTHISEMQWFLLAEIDEEEALMPMASMKYIFVVILCAVPVIMWIVGTVVSKAITSPLNKLQKGTETIGTGDFDIQFEIESNDEVGKLAQSFNEMAGKLKTIRDEAEELNYQLVETTARANDTASQCKQAEESVRCAYKELDNTHKELKETQSQLIQNEKLASIGQLAAGVAHEMNTPVGFVVSNFGTLENYVNKFLKLLDGYKEVAELVDTGTKEQRLTKLQEITEIHDKMKIDFILKDIQGLFDDSREGLDRITNIVQNLRDFSRIDKPGSRDEYNINKGIEATLIVARNEIKYDADIKTDFSEVPLIFCHSGQINQVFLNILVNAAQAIKSQERDGNGTITIRTYSSEDNVVCEIADDGPGIPPETLSKIFDPFFTTKPAGKGTGLGLSVSYDIIANKHNGELLVDSKIGGGTKFTIKLPIGTKENDEQEIMSYGKENSVICG
ncbi:MAG: hypothetical protein CEE38_18960 [Planctomycetes bacterium B3_Pla]|nr:MAG: hypothetical protein CEE38_18960 [Planctomycetes bacterium B3_Pla]